MRRLLTYPLLVLACLIASGPSRAQDSVAAPPTPYIWNSPVSVSTVGAVTLLGASNLIDGAFSKPNLFIREEFQLWRRNHTDNVPLTFDNYIQYLPLSALPLLKLTGIESPHSFAQLTIRAGCGLLLTTCIVQPLKGIVFEWRPDRSSSTSFPSGHTAAAFTGAEMLRLEYGRVSPWIPVAGYAVAAFTGFMRVYNDRHWTSDVLAGAGIGILSANLAFWLSDLLSPKLQDKFPRLYADCNRYVVSL